MVKEIALDQIGAWADYLRGPHIELVIQSAMAGNSAAQLWEIRQPGGQPIILLWDQGNNVLYLCGELTADTAQHELTDLIHTHIRPRSIQLEMTYFKARALTSSIETRLDALFQDIALRELPTLLYTLASAPPVPAVEGIRLLPIDRALLADTSLSNIEHIRAEIQWMWPSEERFYQGFGWAAAVDSQLVCWCTAEYLSADRCGIGITTVPAFERRGIATATAGQFVREALQRGLTPYWECRADNIGSNRVAEKLGFVLLAKERYWAGAFSCIDMLSGGGRCYC
jgi:RimJ/RimL family protein N-acetyltransferase